MHLKLLLRLDLKQAPHLGTENYRQNTCICNGLLVAVFPITAERPFPTSYYQLHFGSSGFNLGKQLSKTDELRVTSGFLQDLFPPCILHFVSWIPMGTTATNLICLEYIQHLYLSIRLFGKPFVFLFLRKTLWPLCLSYPSTQYYWQSDRFLWWFVMSLAKLNKRLSAINLLYRGLLFGWTCLSNNYNSYKYFR